MTDPVRRTMRLSGGGTLSYAVAGEPSRPAILLVHGFPSSSRTFRNVLPALGEVAFAIAPDMPGFGQSDVLPEPSFDAIATAIAELLDELGVGRRYIYLHDFGAPPGLLLAMRQPDLVSGLVIQNANAHPTGLGPQWDATRAFWADPSEANAAAATAHLTFEGTRDQYVAGVPESIASRISPETWAEDWRVMQLPGRLATQRALIADYGNHVDRFGAIARYFRQYHPPAMLLWGRHDPFFALAEVVSWLDAFPSMEAHILDAGHFLLETEAPRAARLISAFIAER